MQAFTVAKRTLEGQDMIYQSMKLTNGIWGLMEIKLAPDNPNIILSFKSRVMEVGISEILFSLTCFLLFRLPSPSSRCTMLYFIIRHRMTSTRVIILYLF